MSNWPVRPLRGRNLLIGNFRVNQRGVSGTVVIASGIYGHDRFKGGASGCTYTFATSNNVTTITITAGSLQQTIEGENIATGTHVLSWTGTAQGKIASGSFGDSGITASLTGGADINVEFDTGTLALTKLEPGKIATPFEDTDFSKELEMCQRYYFKTFPQSVAPAQNAGEPGSILVSAGSSGNFILTTGFPVTMRTSPAIVTYNPFAANAQARNITDSTNTTVLSAGATSDRNVALFATAVAGNANDTMAVHVTAEAEL